MTVKELIGKLRRFPSDAEVGWQDHDASEGELSSRVHDVCLFEPDGSQDEKWTDGITVILR